jgi:hypothetical protein
LIRNTTLDRMSRRLGEEAMGMKNGEPPQEGLKLNRPDKRLEDEVVQLNGLDGGEDEEIIDLVDVVEEPEPRMSITDLATHAEDAGQEEILSLDAYKEPPVREKVETPPQPEPEAVFQGWTDGVGAGVEEVNGQKLEEPSFPPGTEVPEGEELFERIELEDVLEKVERLHPSLEKEWAQLEKGNASSPAGAAASFEDWEKRLTKEKPSGEDELFALDENEPGLASIPLPPGEVGGANEGPSAGGGGEPLVAEEGAIEEISSSSWESLFKMAPADEKAAVYPGPDRMAQAVPVTVEDRGRGKEEAPRQMAGATAPPAGSPGEIDFEELVSPEAWEELLKVEDLSDDKIEQLLRGREKTAAPIAEEPKFEEVDLETPPNGTGTPPSFPGKDWIEEEVIRPAEVRSPGDLPLEEVFGMEALEAGGLEEGGPLSQAEGSGPIPLEEVDLQEAKGASMVWTPVAGKDVKELPEEEFPEAFLEEILQEEELSIEVPKEEKAIPPAIVEVAERLPSAVASEDQIQEIIARGVRTMMEDFVSRVLPEVTRQVVGVTMERIEKMVQEIVPEMAEKAIREEIRRLEKE